MTGRLGEPLVRLERTTSTMDEVTALAERGAAEGTAVLAEVQTAGRGRAGRRWESAPGTAILLSVLLRPRTPPARLPVLPLVFGVAVAEAVETETGLSPRLKWPNDVLLDGQKVAGILAAARPERDESRVVLGLGINVNSAAEDLPPGATSVLMETGRAQDRERLLAALLNRLDAAYRGFEESGGVFELAEWERRAAFLGETVRIQDADRTWEGVFRGVDVDGALLLLTSDGRSHRVMTGDMSRGLRPAATHRRPVGRS